MNSVALLVNALTGGGAERIVLTVAQELKRRGRDVTVVVMEHRIEHAIPESLPIVFLSKKPGGSGLSKFLALFFYSRALAAISRERSWSVVQSHLTRANIVNAFSRLFGAGHEIQIVSHSRPSRMDESGISGMVNRCLARIAYPRASCAVAISRRMAADMRDYFGILESRLRVIHNPYEILRIGAMPASVRHDGRIVAMGRMIPLKRFDLLIDVFSEIATTHPRAELLLIGDGPERGHLAEQARERGVSDRVSFAGFMSDPLPLVKSAALFVLCSSTEGFPNALVESMACGVPVVATDCVSGPREILAPETDYLKQILPGSPIEKTPYGILVPVDDRNGLKEAIECVLSDLPGAAARAESAKDRAADFDVSKIVDSYEKLLYKGIA